MNAVQSGISRQWPDQFGVLAPRLLRNGKAQWLVDAEIVGSDVIGAVAEDSWTGE